MALLIRNGMLMTMTEQGTCKGDILISNGRIVRIDDHIDDDNGAFQHCIDAEGMIILPGMVDACVSDGGCDGEYLAETATNAGVTSALLMPETGKRCRILSREGMQDSTLCICNPEGMTDIQLRNCLQAHNSEGIRDLCEITSREQFSRVMKIAASVHARIILTNLSGCDGLEHEIADSGCSVILGVRNSRCGSPWRMAAALDALGVPVALSCRHPAAKMKLLPVCAALCVREGMRSEHALKAITSVPASMLCLHDCGRIEVGCRADLAIFDGDPLLLATELVEVIAGGKLQRGVS